MAVLRRLFRRHPPKRVATSNRSSTPGLKSKCEQVWRGRFHKPRLKLNLYRSIMEGMAVMVATALRPLHLLMTGPRSSGPTTSKDCAWLAGQISREWSAHPIRAGPRRLGWRVLRDPMRGYRSCIYKDVVGIFSEALETL